MDRFDLKTIWIKGWRRKMASLSLLAHVALASLCTGLAKSSCAKENLLLQVGSKVGLSVGKQDPSCGNEFCENLYPGSWCRESNRVCQWVDVPCGCETTQSLTQTTTTRKPTTSTTTTTITQTTTTQAPTLTTTTMSAPSTSSSQQGTTVSQLCGDELCVSTRPGSWCKVNNGLCQWSNTPCACDASGSTTSAEPSSTSGTSSTSSTSSTETTGPYAKYVSSQKALYVWNPGDLSQAWWNWRSSDIELLISVCRLHGFKRAIVFIGSVQWDWQTFQAKELPHQEAFVSLFAALRAAGILPLACYYLNDGPNDLSNWQRAADVVSAVHEFNQAFPASAVEGIEGDQEPTSISAEYLQMNEMIRARRDQLNAQLKLSVSLKPGWLRRTYQEENMVSAALGALDVGMIMAYSSSPSTSQAWGDQALARATETNKKLTVAIETSPRAPQSDTFWEVASQDGSR